MKRETIHNIPYQQFHPSKLPRSNSVLELGPGQVVIIPLTFIPRFLDVDVADDYVFLDDGIGEDVFDSLANDPKNHNSSTSYYYTAFQKADWEDWGNSPQDYSLFAQFSPSIQNNKQSEFPNHQRHNPKSGPRVKEKHRRSVHYKVRTILYINTNRGIVELSLEAISRRENQFSLPDVIAFSFNDECNATFRGERGAGLTASRTSPTVEASSSAPSVSASLETSEEEQERIIAETLRLFRKKINNSDEKRKSRNSETKKERNRKDDFFTTTKSSSSEASSDNSIFIVDTKSTANIAFEKFEYQQHGDDPKQDLSSLAAYSPCDCYDLFIKHPGLGSSSYQASASASPNINSIYSKASEQDKNQNKRKKMSDDLHLDNSGNFYVVEALVSRPELVSLQLLPPTRLQLLVSQQYLYQEVTPRQMINEWVKISSHGVHEDLSSSNSTKTSDGNEFVTDKSLCVPADGKQHYIVTICCNSKINSKVQINANTSKSIKDMQEFFDSSFPDNESTTHDRNRSNRNNMTKTKSLGFLQIRTNLDTLFIALEQKHDNTSFESSRFSVFGSSILKRANKSKKQSDRVSDSSEHRLEQLGRNPIASSTSGPSTVKGTALKQSLRTYPEHVYFNFLQTGNPSLTYGIDLENIVQDESVYIRRVSIALQPPTFLEEDPNVVGRQHSKRKPEKGKIGTMKSSPLDKMGISLKLVGLNASLGSLLTPRNKDELGTAGNSSKITSAIQITCSVDWKKLRHLKDGMFARQPALSNLNLHGAIVIRGNTIRSAEMKTIDYLLQSQLVESIADIRKQTNFVLEIPLTITIHKNAMLGLDVLETTHPYSLFWLFSNDHWFGSSKALRGAFFPLTPEVFLPGLTSQEKLELKEPSALESIHLSTAHDGVVHRLRLYDLELDSRSTLEIESIDVIPASAFDDSKAGKKIKSGLDEARQNWEDSNCNICNRFSASHSKTSNKKNNERNSLSVGTIDLNYSFGEEYEYSTSDESTSEKCKGYSPKTELAHSFTCNLQVKTSPDTGIHTLPLLAYSGRIEISSRSYLSQFFPSDNSGNAESRLDHIVGFENVVDWFVNSTVGSALRVLLTGNRKSKSSKLSPEDVLTRYLHSLLESEELKETERKRSKSKIQGYKDGFKMERKLRPIVLKAASIADDDVEVVPLIITNHNPLPITISVDIAQVEGLAISIGRDPTIENAKSPNNLQYSDFRAGKNDRRDSKRRVKKQFRSLSDYVARMYSRDASNLETKTKQYMEPRVKEGNFDGHPLHALRDFLLTDDIALSLFKQFPYQDAMSLGESAVGEQSLLGQVYRFHARARLHKTGTSIDVMSRNQTRCKWEQVGHPPLYGTLSERDRLSTPMLAKRPVVGPLILSDENSRYRQLEVCSRKHSSNGIDKVVLPPGGVVRFDVWVRSPGISMSDKDISNFVATGLVLSTNLGETLPLFVCFEALQGKLEVSHIPTLQLQQPQIPDHLKKMKRGTRILVPTGLFGRVNANTTMSQKSVKIPPRGERTATFSELTQGQMIFARNASLEEHGVTLFMKSSFTKDIDLHEVISCNPWFQVTLMNQSSQGASNIIPFDPFLGSQIGTINSVVPCDAFNGVPFNATAFPSFYRCVLNWFSHRSDLQSNGCGRGIRFESGIANQSEESTTSGFNVKKVASVFQRALLISEWSDELYSSSEGRRTRSSDAKRYAGIKHPVKSGRRGEDGIVAPLLIEAMADAFVAYDQASDNDMLVIGTSLRAVMEYKNHDDENLANPQTSPSFGINLEDDRQGGILSAMIKNVTFESHLAIPRLANFAKLSQQRHCSSRLESKLLPTSTVCFEPTLIGNVASGNIPIRNPTPIALRVRLGVASTGMNSLYNNFVGSYQSPYVQSRRKARISPRDYAHHQWWDWGGSFFHHDSSGNLLRSHYNITMKAGSGARVSLVNPSFLASSAFLVGCGNRCGLRNERQPNFEIIVNLAPTSPIGASAAIGKFLIGRQRSAPGLVDIYNTADNDFSLLAGGSLISGGQGPSAFAIPFSALDEIIVPPFGEVELGPILFRPPGRTRIIGCEASTGSVQYEHCESQEFEGNVFIENSLTGLERVTLRGKALLEKVVFVDPSDAEFGNIELRYGHSTLVFPGTARDTSVAITKQILVQNDGDTHVTITGGYFLPVSDFRQAAGGAKGSSHACELNRFELLGCQKEGSIFPFELYPGQSRSLWIEHRPQCSKKKDYVVLVLDVDRKVKKTSNDAYQTGETMHKQHIHINTNPFHVKRLELFVGYEMTSTQFASCIPYVSPTQGIDEWKRRLQSNTSGTGHNPVKQSLPYRFMTVQGIITCVSIVVSILWILFHASKLSLIRDQSCSRRLRYAAYQARAVQEQKGPPVLTTGQWEHSLRNIGRTNPTSADLCNFAREKIRTLLLSRYRALGVSPPHCFSSVGMPLRERAGFVGNIGGRHGASIQSSKGSVANGGNERNRTLSDSIFGRYSSDQSVADGILPARLGWRTAASSGIINSSTIKDFHFQSKAKALLLDRINNPVSIDSDHSTDSSDAEGESKSFHDSDLDSSYDHSLQDEAEKPGMDFVSIISTSAEPTNGGERNDLHKALLAETIESKDSSELHADFDLVKPKEPDTSKFTSQSLESTRAEASPLAEMIEIKNNDALREPSKPDTDITILQIHSLSNDIPQRSETKPTNQPAFEVVVPKTVLTSLGDPLENPQSSRNNQRKKNQSKDSTNRKEKGNTTKHSSIEKEKELPQSQSTKKSLVSPAKPIRQKTKQTTEDSRQNVKEKNQEDVKGEKKKTQVKERSTRRKPMIGKSAVLKESSLLEKDAVQDQPNPLIATESTPESPHFRLPPGLAPPPGFGDVAVSIPYTQSSSIADDMILAFPTSSQQLHDDAIGLRYDPTSGEISHTELGLLVPQNLVSHFTSASTHIPAPNTQEESPQLTSSVPIGPLDLLYPWGASTSESGNSLFPENNSSTAGFDVMDFLDGILNDGNSSAEDEVVEILPATLIMESAMITSTTSSPSRPRNSSLLPLAPNPWALEEPLDRSQSRLSAYGIVFEDPGDRIPIETQVALALPILEESAIFLQSTHNENEDPI